jgi:hypothetical protein
MMIERPGPDEHAPFATGYIATAARKVEESGSDIVSLLEKQSPILDAMLRDSDPDLAAFSYAPGKWTLSESIVHIGDTERVFAYRLLRFARADATPLSPFDQDQWVPESRSAKRTLPDVLDEFSAVRAASLALVKSLDETALTRVGTASGYRTSTRALVWMIAGHAAHHIEITSARYLAGWAGR